MNVVYKVEIQMIITQLFGQQWALFFPPSLFFLSLPKNKFSHNKLISVLCVHQPQMI